MSPAIAFFVGVIVGSFVYLASQWVQVYILTPKRLENESEAERRKARAKQIAGKQ